MYLLDLIWLPEKCNSKLSPENHKAQSKSVEALWIDDNLDPVLVCFSLAGFGFWCLEIRINRSDTLQNLAIQLFTLM